MRIGPFGGVLIVAISGVAFSSGVILCDSPPSSTDPPVPKSSSSKPPFLTSLTTTRQFTAEDEVYARSKRKEQATTEKQTELSALERLKSNLTDFQSKIPAPNISISPETFGLPPNFLEWVDKMRAEVSFAPGSVADEIWQESKDPIRNPEIEQDARVWLGNEFCKEEMAFSEKRRKFTRKGLAKYLGVKEWEIDERDIPTIAVAGSGGGYRAMLGTTGYFKAMKEAGLFDCLTYMAGLSCFKSD
jgi:Lysophospholipase catalytic domain